MKNPLNGLGSKRFAILLLAAVLIVSAVAASTILWTHTISYTIPSSITVYGLEGNPSTTSLTEGTFGSPIGTDLTEDGITAATTYYFYYAIDNTGGTFSFAPPTELPTGASATWKITATSSGEPSTWTVGDWSSISFASGTWVIVELILTVTATGSYSFSFVTP